MNVDHRSIRVVSIMEAQFVTGPAKNLLAFAQRARSAPQGLPAIDLSVVTYHRDPAAKPSDNPFIAAADQAAVPVDVIYEKRRFDQTVLPQIAAALERRQPLIVQTHNVKSHFLMRYSGLWRKYRWIAFHHGYTSTDLKMRLYNQLDWWSLRKAAHLVTVCGPFERQLEERGVDAGRITIQHNSIRPFEPMSEEESSTVRQALNCARNTSILLMVSRLSHEKGHLDFLQALAVLKRRGVDFHALIVGEGPERGPIERLRERLELTAMVTLVGQQNDVRPFYAVATLYVMPSHSEGSPNALLEAMAAGIPIVAAAVGGIPEIVTSGETGLLVPPMNPEALADAMEQLLKDPALAAQFAQNALRETAKFTYEAYHQALAGIYRRVLDQPAGEA
jgi:glycosyltransferase involved in cell wall biosynthesis